MGKANSYYSSVEKGWVIQNRWGSKLAVFQDAGVAQFFNVGLGTSASPQALVAGSPFLNIYTTCASTDGSTNAQPVLFNTVMTGAGGVGGRVRVNMDTNVTLGGWANAFKASVDCKTSGASIGLLSVACLEITMPASAGAGAYSTLELEIGCPTSWAGVYNQATSFIYCQSSGATKSNFDTYGLFLHLDNGFTAASGKFLSADKQTLKCAIGANPVSTFRYLVLSQAENYPYFNMATLGNTNDRFASFKGTQATPAMADGYGLFEIELTVTGLATGQINATSTWINLGTSATVPGYITLHTDGIWDGSATLTTAMVSMQKYTCQLASNPVWLSIFELNYQQDAYNVIDAIFNVNDEARALGFVAGTTAPAITGSIPFFSAAGGAVRYIMVYGGRAT